MFSNTPPPLRSMVRRQKSRIIETLIASLPLQLSIDATDEGVEGIIPTPEAPDYWMITTTSLPEVLNHREVAVIVAQVGTTDYPIRLSGDQISASMQTLARISVIIVFKRPAAYPLLERRGRQLLEVEITELMADIYRGAVLEVLLRDAVDGQDVLDVKIVSDFADSILSQEGDALGRAVLELELMGQGTHPQPQYRLPQESP